MGIQVLNNRHFAGNLGNQMDNVRSKEWSNRSQEQVRRISTCLPEQTKLHDIGPIKRRSSACSASTITTKIQVNINQENLDNLKENSKSNIEQEKTILNKILKKHVLNQDSTSQVSDDNKSDINSELKVHDDFISESVRQYIEQKARLLGCKEIHICDGSETERKWLLDLMIESKMITPLKKRHNCWLARTDPRDVARVESKTYICTRNKHDVVCRDSVEGANLGNWMHIDDLEKRLNELLPNCMAGRRMFVIPFSMGPIGSELSKVGIQLTDSPYVVVSMMIMTRVSRQIFDIIKKQGDSNYVKCLHSVGCPLPLTRDLINNWPCNPDKTIISHIPERREIISFGSGYGGNSLLGKKCFALRLGSIMGKQEAWLAEHMLIMSITNEHGLKRYIAAAFPSACGKTNLAMMRPTLPGYKIECVGDDIAWMRFDSNGILRAINPEAGFFGVAPGTNNNSNPIAMKTVECNTIFTNIAETADGDFYWEGLEAQLRNEIQSSKERSSSSSISIIDWQGKERKIDLAESSSSLAKSRDQNVQLVAHPNSRFCCPANQCPIMDSEWQNPEGVPISAIIFGGRRPEGVPLVYEAFNWEHGVYLGASMRSESTAAAEHKANTIMHDPFAMRPFFGYNFGQYLEHWLSFSNSNQKRHSSSDSPTKELQLPKIFHVNWFGRDKETGNFLWPGYGENSRVLDWILRRIDDEPCANISPIGLIPKKDSLNLIGIEDKVNDEKLDLLLKVSRDFWLKEQAIVDRYFKDNVGSDLPEQIKRQSNLLRKRLELASVVWQEDNNKC